MIANQAVLLPPGTVHLCQPDDISQFTFRMMYVDPEWFCLAFELDARTLPPQTAQLTEKSIKLKNHFFGSFALPQDSLAVESEAVFFIGKLLFDEFDLAGPRPVALQKDNAVSALKDYIDKHFLEQIQLDHLAGIIKQSKFSLLRKFSKAYKFTPHAYILNKRINKAKQLLSDGAPIAETAAQCGFYDQSHFVKTFRLYVGMTPIEYK